MRNQFVAMVMAAVAMQKMFRTRAPAAFNAGEFAEQSRPTSYAKKTGLTVAANKRAAIKSKNRAKHRAASATAKKPRSVRLVPPLARYFSGWV